MVTLLHKFTPEMLARSAAHKLPYHRGIISGAYVGRDNTHPAYPVGLNVEVQCGDGKGVVIYEFALIPHVMHAFDVERTDELVGKEVVAHAPFYISGDKRTHFAGIRPTEQIENHIHVPYTYYG